MKHQISLLAIIILNLFFIHCVDAQRANKNELRVTFTQYPTNPLPESVKTYSTKINPGDISFKYIHLNKPLAYVETGTSNLVPVENVKEPLQSPVDPLEPPIPLNRNWKKPFRKVSSSISRIPGRVKLC